MKTPRIENKVVGTPLRPEKDFVGGKSLEHRDVRIIAYPYISVF